jgi:hypothetical protein
MTDIEYSRKDRSISSWISIGSIGPMVVPSLEPLGVDPPGLFPLPRAIKRTASATRLRSPLPLDHHKIAG